MRREPRRMLAVSLAVLAVAAGCSKSAGSQETDKKAVKVTVAVADPHGTSHLPVMLAERLGFYADEGLDVRVVDFQAGPKVLAAMVAGDADVASGFYGDTLTMALKGKAFRSFVTTVNSPGLALAVSPATGRSIGRLADLKGGVVGVSAPGSGTHIFLNYLLDRDRIDRDEVAVAGIGLAATAVAATERGQVDAAVLLEPAISQLDRRTGGVKLLVDTRDPTVAAEIFETDAFPGIGVYARSRWLEMHPDTARKFATAVIRSLHWIHDHSAEQVADAMGPEPTGGDRALYMAVIASAQRTVSVDGLIDADGAEAVQRFLSVTLPEMGKADIDLTATFTNEFVAR